MTPEKNEDLQEGCDVQSQDQIDVVDSVAADVTMYDVESPLQIAPCDLPDCIEGQSDSEEEDYLIDIMTAVDVLEKEAAGDANSADTTMDGIATGLDDSLLETSIDQLTLDDDTPRDENIMTAFGFQKYSPPPLLTRHPPPASGRDDDINKLREILDDILIKTELDDNLGYDVCLDRILLGPDNKIGMNLLSLIKENKKYAKFLPEFPLLHLRKSKVNTLFSAYKHAGLVELLMVMRDQDVTEWSKLLTADHIDTATRHVRRIAQALQMAFLLKFIQSLDDDDAKIITWQLITGKSTTASETWDERMMQFMDKGRQMNATFALHYDMMTHCNEVVAISVSERLGGSKGYSLLLGTVKSSLKFSFLNGATSYAPYCARLLAHHYTAGIFHQKLKETLYSTPIGNSTVNFACDTKREMDHKDALKGFRSGSSLESASRRMSLIDAFNDIHSTKEKTKENDGVQWLFSNVDAEHIFRVVEVILRQNSLSLEACTTPFNMYSEKRSLLSREILDDDTRAIGEYLIQKFICHDQLFGLSSADVPSLMTVEGPKPLLSRVKRSKGVTIKRTIKASRYVQQSERDEKEAKRSKAIRREVKQTDCLSSEMNMCQALVKPDCSKPKVQKSTSMKNALMKCIEDCQAGNRHGVIESVKGPLPIWLTGNVKLVTLEFAGVKFKSKVITGKQYLHYVQNAILRPLPSKMPNLERIVLCEEKYSFTPDQFKAGTRQQRKKACSVSSITHLKPADDAITQQRFQRDVITGTTFGKSLISKYVAANAKDLLLPPGITLDIDSELEMHTCTCDGACTCKHYATPIRCTFDKESQKPTITALVDVQQRKGEAEMSQVDWLIASRSDLKAGERVVSLITSGDIDAVCIHLYAISKHWPRDDNGSFINEVFVVLQKPHMLHDIYNITAIIQLFEDKYQDPDIGVKLALGLCIGGNDFIPKFKGISHTQILKTYLSSSHFRQNLFQISKGTQPSIDKDIYEDFVKHLYCPKNVSPNSVTVEEVRAVSMKLKKKSDDSFISQLELRNAETWMPPTSALHRLADLIQLQVEYLETAGYHDADLPDFMASSCLKITKTGEVEYDFGPEVHMNVQDIQTKIKDGKRKQEDTPQKGQRRKRQLTSTPRKKP
ncbi:uncharacterized protein [Haliotis cracherodii]|uniref:uncharacterized protein n=1 Tax=Haliotis cracherodii TaxID=6455 RepID=UPI0039E83696